MSAAETIKGTLKFLGRVFPHEPGRRVVALCYHSVHPSMPFRSATPELFSEHLAWLAENCRCVPFSEVLSTRDHPDDGRPVVSLTFDDGYADNHEFALPLLADNGLTATFFLTAGLLERDPSTLERFRYLRGLDYGVIQPLRWEQVREMLAAGMEVGAHSYSHANLARVDNSDLEHEISHSKRIIEDRLGIETRMMAYPFGRPRVHISDRVVAAVRSAGYDLAGSVITRGIKVTDNPLSVPRMFATRDSVNVLREKVLGVWDLIGTVREKMPLAVSRIVSPADFRF